MTKRQAVLKDFFISYNSNDKAWAEWIAWTLEANGLSTIIQEWDFRPGGDFVLEMQKATVGTKRTLAVLSDNYLQAAYTQPEWAQAFANDPKGDDRKLLFVRVAACSPKGLLKGRIYTDLVGKSEEEARRTLLTSFEERAKPTTQPSFPGETNGPHHSAIPVFPGTIVRADTTLRATNARQKHLADELEKARIRKARLSSRDEDTTQIGEEILAIKRELRCGGQLRPGDQLSDRYLLLDQLGRGGYATVWKAYDNQENCNVAIKALNTSEAANATSVDRFFRGARIMAEFADNDGIVTVLDPKCDDDGYLYFVMEVVASGNLHEAVLERRKTAADAVPIMQRILAILEQAHSHASRYVHRDIKPTNVLLTPDGGLKLTDFDLVTANNTTGGTRTGMLGTFVFAAPEQLSRPQEADHRADIFGVAMTGIFVLHGKDLPLMAWRRPEEFIDRLEAPTGVKSALIKATEEDPNHRFASAAEFLEALRNPGGSIAKAAKGRSSRKKRSRKKRISANGATQQQKRRYPIPDIPAKKVEDALEIFDREHREEGRWRAFENNQKHRYAIEHNGNRYPVKKILSLATGLPVDHFSGGNAANKRIADLGFRIVEIRAEEQHPATVGHSVDGTNIASRSGSSAPDDTAVRIEASD